MSHPSGFGKRPEERAIYLTSRHGQSTAHRLRLRSDLIIAISTFRGLAVHFTQNPLTPRVVIRSHAQALA
jgi:hypothetical protein